MTQVDGGFSLLCFCGCSDMGYGQYTYCTKNPQDLEHPESIFFGNPISSREIHPLLIHDNMLESNPLESRFLVCGLAVDVWYSHALFAIPSHTWKPCWSEPGLIHERQALNRSFRQNETTGVLSTIWQGEPSQFMSVLLYPSVNNQTALSGLPTFSNSIFETHLGVIWCITNDIWHVT